MLTSLIRCFYHVDLDQNFTLCLWIDSSSETAKVEKVYLGS
jgi:hypothetical protein